MLRILLDSSSAKWLPAVEGLIFWLFFSCMVIKPYPREFRVLEPPPELMTQWDCCSRLLTVFPLLRLSHFDIMASILLKLWI